ncbi:MAG: hypothetical protein JXQ73_17485 [Phycisphaerae bacterium]|nr:hypothetical protein [Phycisphaerae bacterium]
MSDDNGAETSSVPTGEATPHPDGGSQAGPPSRAWRIAKRSLLAVVLLLVVGEIAVRVLGLDPPPVLTVAERDNYVGIRDHLKWQYELEARLDFATSKRSQLVEAKAKPEEIAKAKQDLAKAEEDLSTCLANAPNRKFSFRGYWPGVPVEFAQDVELNELWLRDYTYDPNKPGDVRRLVILGDSYTSAWEVDFDEMYHKRLAHELTAQAGPGRKIEVPAFSVPAMGLGELKKWFLHRALALQPDVLALVISPALVSENYGPLCQKLELKFGKLLKYFIANTRKVEKKWLVVPFSALNRYVARLAAGFYIMHLDWFEDLEAFHPVNPTVSTYIEPEPPDWQKAWEGTKAALAEYGDLCRERNIPLLVVLMPTEVAIDSAFAQPPEGSTVDWTKADRRFAEMCKEIGADFMTLTPTFDAYRAKHGKDYQFDWDIHWNAKGHEIAARAIMEYVRANYARQLGLASSSPTTTSRPVR